MSKIANRNNWLDYLRSFIIVLVVAHHSSLAYTTFAHFNKDAYILSTHPIVDAARWKGLDIFEDFNDVFFMSLLYLISGLFVFQSLENKGVKRFIRDRFRRLFIPFVVGVTVLMLLAYYPAYLLAHGGSLPGTPAMQGVVVPPGGDGTTVPPGMSGTVGGDGATVLMEMAETIGLPGEDGTIGTMMVDGLPEMAIPPGIGGRLGATVLAGMNGRPGTMLPLEMSGLRAYLVDFFTVEAWPVGPPWFIWVLFLFNLVFAGCYPFIKKGRHKLGLFLAQQKEYPLRIGIAWLLLTWIAYIPFMWLFGADSWTGWGPFDFQKSRLFLYFCYFLVGVLIGASGLTTGLLSGESHLVKTGTFWLAGCLTIYALLKLNEASLTDLVSRHRLGQVAATMIYRSIWVLSCTFSCIALLTTFKEWIRRSSAWWDSLSANAYGIYLIHYIFVVWCQYGLLTIHLPAVVKFLITLVVSLAGSWLVTVLLRRNEVIRKYL